MQHQLPFLEDLLARRRKLAVIGLGYVGLPVALEFAKYISVIGFDINEGRVAMMQHGEDPSRELPASAFDGKDIRFTSRIDDLKEASFYIVAVPTPLSAGKEPDLHPVLSASETIGKVIKRGDYVVFESTVYPGCTEEDCVPVIEKHSGLKMTAEFFVGYSPERINPGDKDRNVSNIVKIVSGCCEGSLRTVSAVYELIVQAGVFKASSIKVAESAKIIENTQRDLNIALMNELSMIFGKMNINTFEVLDAAASKWNFLPFQPGLVGGHCIGIDPYYLTYKADKVGQKGSLITQGREVNDGMADYVAAQIESHVIARGVDQTKARVLVLGITFKENVSDIRNSKTAEVVTSLLSKGIQVDVYDPVADPGEVKEEYVFEPINAPSDQYDCVLLAVPHKQFTLLQTKEIAALLKSNGLFYDLKGIFRRGAFEFDYKTL